MKRKIVVLALVSLLLSVVAGYGQSNDRIDELLVQDPAQTGHVAYLLLSAAGLIDDQYDPETALTYASEQGLLPGRVDATDAVTFGRYSYLLTQAFDVPGGVMYRLLPGPRYAAREVVYQQWSRKRRSPSELIDGETAVRILSVYLNETGGTQ